MERRQLERRDFLQVFSALGAAAALPIDALAKPYDPAAKFDLKVSDVPFRRNAAGRQLSARIYQPQGPGPFPLVLDLHGGAWTRKDRYAEEPMDRAIAASGVVVVAIDMTLSGEAPYPANIQDANYGIRWLKSKAREMERRRLERGHLRQLHRRPHRHPARHAPARRALQRHSPRGRSPY